MGPAIAGLAEPTPTAIFSVLEVYGELHYVYNINTTYWQT